MIRFRLCECLNQLCLFFENSSTSSILPACLLFNYDSRKIIIVYYYFIGFEVCIINRSSNMNCIMYFLSVVCFFLLLFQLQTACQINLECVYAPCIPSILCFCFYFSLHFPKRNKKEFSLLLFRLSVGCAAIAFLLFMRALCVQHGLSNWKRYSFSLLSFVLVFFMQICFFRCCCCSFYYYYYNMEWIRRNPSEWACVYPHSFIYNICWSWQRIVKR